MDDDIPLDLAGQVLKKLLSLPTRTIQRRYLVQVASQMHPEQADALADQLKELVVKNLWADNQSALFYSTLILVLSKCTSDDLHRALGLRMKAQAIMLGKGEYQRALRLYHRALAIHRRKADRLGEAMVYLTSIWALANVGKYHQAIQAGEWCGQVLKEYQQWRAYATLQNNLSAIYNRSLDFQRALCCTEEAGQVFSQIGEAGKFFLPNAEVNRAMALCNLGRFQESLQASQAALELARAYDQKIVFARAQHNLAITYYMMGRYNKALDLLIEAKSAHEAAGQPHEAALCDLSETDCLLELNRLEDVRELCERILPVFMGLGMLLEAAEVGHNQALAYLRQNRIQEAIQSLLIVRRIFEAEKLADWMAFTDLEIAQMHLHAGQPDLALSLAQASQAQITMASLPFEALQAYLIEARALFDLGDLPRARAILDANLPAAETQNWPVFSVQFFHLMGRVLLVSGEKRAALQRYTQAVEALELLRSQVMIEFRASFLQDRSIVYTEMISLCLELNEPALAMQYAERARSRAILELLWGRANLSLRSQHPADHPLVENIVQLQAQRQQFVRRLEYLSLGLAPEVGEESLKIQEQVLAVEKEITRVWHILMVRNTAYEQDAALWQVHPGGIPEPARDGSLLLEYFALKDHLVLFLLFPTPAGDPPRLQVIHLAASLPQIEQLVQLLLLNMQNMPYSSLPSRAGLEVNARGLLKRLYDLLIAPAAGALAEVERLVIVPYGPLHYLPFHALYDGAQYLVQSHTLRYLPSGAFLNAARIPLDGQQPVLVMGNSFHGSLPSAVQEAAQIAAMWNAAPVLENDATLAHLRSHFEDCRMIHLACHGDFRPDNPLFSGIALEDDWLTTLEIFSLRTNASLVTLSACQTGRGVVGSGDELSGLMRALFAAGAASLALSHWRVADQSTAELMKTFYSALASGAEKAAALRSAQVALCSQPEFRHPYFWAPFFLVGDGGLL